MYFLFYTLIITLKGSKDPRLHTGRGETPRGLIFWENNFKIDMVAYLLLRNGMRTRIRPMSCQLFLTGKIPFSTSPTSSIE